MTKRYGKLIDSYQVNENLIELFKYGHFFNAYVNKSKVARFNVEEEAKAYVKGYVEMSKIPLIEGYKVKRKSMPELPGKHIFGFAGVSIKNGIYIDIQLIEKRYVVFFNDKQISSFENERTARCYFLGYDGISERISLPSLFS